MNSRPIILFDGICNLCDGAVQFVIKHDPEKKFLFASLQSEAGLQLLKQYKLPVETFSSFILIKDEKVYSKSTGALKVARQIEGVWSWLYIFIIIPAFIRDTVYTWIAKNRYKWFGKKETCLTPTPELKSRFL
jgi:predicted DCC family thiol-disulfide oxidoreductase YuxK